MIVKIANVEVECFSFQTDFQGNVLPGASKNYKDTKFRKHGAGKI